MTICAVIAGVDDFVTIAHLVKTKKRIGLRPVKRVTKSN